jgi:hypothetical protein
VTDKERDKNAARCLAIIRHAQEVTGNVAMTCRYYLRTNAKPSSRAEPLTEAGANALIAAIPSRSMTASATAPWWQCSTAAACGSLRRSRSRPRTVTPPEQLRELAAAK